VDLLDGIEQERAGTFKGRSSLQTFLPCDITFLPYNSKFQLERDQSERGYFQSGQGFWNKEQNELKEVGRLR
jgi:hypothetical protein